MVTVRTVRQRVDLSPIPGPALRYLMLIKEQRDEINERVGRTRNRPGVADAAVRRDTIEQGGAGNGRSERPERSATRSNATGRGESEGSGTRSGDTTDDRGERRPIRARGQRRTRTVRQRNGP